MEYSELYVKRIRKLCRDRGICTLSEMNPGNHFTEPAKRMAKGIRWLLEG